MLRIMVPPPPKLPPKPPPVLVSDQPTILFPFRPAMPPFPYPMPPPASPLPLASSSHTPCRRLHLLFPSSPKSCPNISPLSLPGPPQPSSIYKPTFYFLTQPIHIIPYAKVGFEVVEVELFAQMDRVDIEVDSGREFCECKGVSDMSSTTRVAGVETEEGELNVAGN